MKSFHPKFLLPTGLISLLFMTPICLLYFKLTPPPQQNGCEIRVLSGSWEQVGSYVDFKVDKKSSSFAHELDTLTNFLITSQKSKYGYGLGLPRLFISRHCSYQDFINIADLVHQHDHFLILYDDNFYFFSNRQTFFDDPPPYHIKFNNYVEPWWETVWFDIKGRVMSDYNSVKDAISTNWRYEIFLFYWFLMLLYNGFRVVLNSRRRLTSRSS
jgi:hypothetical protein